MEWQKEELKYGTVMESCRLGGSSAAIDEDAATLFGIKIVRDFDRPCFIGLYKEVK